MREVFRRDTPSPTRAFMVAVALLSAMFGALRPPPWCWVVGGATLCWELWPFVAHFRRRFR